MVLQMTDICKEYQMGKNVLPVLKNESDKCQIPLICMDDSKFLNEIMIVSLRLIRINIISPIKLQIFFS